MLLLKKKHSAFLRAKAAIVTVFIGVFIVFVHPAYANAGFFENVLGFFGLSSKSGVEESAPIFIKETQAATAAMPALDSTPNPDGETTKNSGGNQLQISQDSALVAPLNPTGILVNNSALPGQIFIYTIKPGDNPSAIAKSFGITLNTLLWANNITDLRNIQVGDKLIILPISGVQVEIKKGDTIDSIVKKYRGNKEDILAFNGLALDEPLLPGTAIIIPDGEMSGGIPSQSGPVSSRRREISNYPSYDGYYIRPIRGGVRTQGIHGYNAVDLSNSCGSPIFASADGTVIIAKNGGWNGGYGKYIAIAHTNGTQTLYAHDSDIFVQSGEGVNQGQLIATVGNTGNTTGKTGCHVHFEIRGAKNPF